MKKIFISYAREDYPAAKLLFDDLQSAGFAPWLDRESILPGERWEVAIHRAIRDSHYFLAILSASAVNKRGYVQKELRQGLEVWEEFPDDQIFLIPIRLDDCRPTHEQLTRFHWLDLFPDYNAGIEKLIQTIREGQRPIASYRHEALSEEFDVNNIGAQTLVDVKNSNPLRRVVIVLASLLLGLPVIIIAWTLAVGTDQSEQPAMDNLATATDSAFNAGLGLLSAPFHRPFQYVGMSVADAAKAVGGTPNEANNIVLDNDEVHMLLEAEGHFVSYVDIQLKRTAPCSQTAGFDSIPLLGALSINPSELELVRKQPHFHTYYDHKRKLKVSVACLFDGAPLSVGFSSKYYKN